DGGVPDAGPVDAGAPAAADAPRALTHDGCAAAPDGAGGWSWGAALLALLGWCRRRR
ncbi:MAG: hypothetical protein H6704_16655, partial [Myxococcales bacterium]|nr:hypothetical protein [Myxococcales bacterium]